MLRTVIPVDKLLAWAKLNGVDFSYLDVEHSIVSNGRAHKGAMLISKSDLDNDGNGTVLMSVPQDLILSQEQVKRYGAIDKNLSLVLEAAGAFGQVCAWSPDSTQFAQTKHCQLLNQFDWLTVLDS